MTTKFVFALAAALIFNAIPAHGQQQAQPVDAAAKVLAAFDQAIAKIEGAEPLTLQQRQEIAVAAIAGAEQERMANAAAASLDNPTLLNRVLICGKIKVAAIAFKYEKGICLDLEGYAFVMSAVGLGVTGGVGSPGGLLSKAGLGGAASIQVMVYVGPQDIPLTHNWFGMEAGVSGANKYRMALKMVKILKGLPKWAGPDFAVFSDGRHGGFLVMLGVQLGPMIDLSAEQFKLEYW